MFYCDFFVYLNMAEIKNNFLLADQVCLKFLIKVAELNVSIFIEAWGHTQQDLTFLLGKNTCFSVC